MKRRATTYDKPILRALLGSSLTTPQIWERIGMGTRPSVDRALASMRDRGLVHIVRYDRGADGPPKPVWIAGPGKDAARPAPLTRSQRAKRIRDRLREEDPLQYKAVVARGNLRRRGHAVRADKASSWLAAPIIANDQ